MSNSTLYALLLVSVSLRSELFSEPLLLFLECFLSWYSNRHVLERDAYLRAEMLTPNFTIDFYCKHLIDRSPTQFSASSSDWVKSTTVFYECFMCSFSVSSFFVAPARPRNSWAPVTVAQIFIHAVVGFSHRSVPTSVPSVSSANGAFSTPFRIALERILPRNSDMVHITQYGIYSVNVPGSS